ncbi:MAG: SDR family NAD(P)-dependent oxidoreductase [Burkholderiaceae bacterium]|jgi:NAD(P)-dependent dehydrogenase (short-subunit alcohol dehydrogenase family)
MSPNGYETALIVGAGSGLSASLARRCKAQGMRVALAARDVAKLESLRAEIGGLALACDVAEPSQVESLFANAEAGLGVIDAVFFNPSQRSRGPLIDLDPGTVAHNLSVTAYGGFLVAQQAARRMLPRHHGAIFFTGASASVKGYPGSAPFAMGKFALRGLAQSIARELAPGGIHVAHFIIDGAIRPAQSTDAGDAQLDPDAIAQTYMAILGQHRSAWTWEVEVRPWVEKF